MKTWLFLNLNLTAGPFAFAPSRINTKTEDNHDTTNLTDETGWLPVEIAILGSHCVIDTLYYTHSVAHIAS